MNLTSFLQDKQLTLALYGEIDHHVAKTTITAIAEKIDTFLPRVCVLDFAEVAFMDSSGIAVVINALRRMQEIGGDLQIKNLQGQPKKVLMASGINKLVKF